MADKRKPKRERRLKYVCYTCGRRGSKYESQTIEQRITGRRFCSETCWKAHLKSEGF